jgi:hypothetical protein
MKRKAAEMRPFFLFSDRLFSPALRVKVASSFANALTLIHRGA